MHQSGVVLYALSFVGFDRISSLPIANRSCLFSGARDNSQRRCQVLGQDRTIQRLGWRRLRYEDVRAGSLIRLPNGVWLSGTYLQGEANSAPGTQWGDFDESDADIFVGYSFEIVDLGIGVRNTQIDRTETVNIDGRTFSTGEGSVDETLFGAYIGMGTLLGDGPFGLYGGGTLLANGTVNAEGGMSLSLDPWQITLGYRYMSIEVDISGDDTRQDDHQGITAGVSFSF